MDDTAPARRWTGQRRACAAGSYEVTPSDRLVSGECPSQADESTSGQSERTSAGLDGVRPGSGIHPHAGQFSLRSGGPSAGYVNPRCRVGAHLVRLMPWPTPKQSPTQRRRGGTTRTPGGPGQSDGTLALSDNRLTFATTGAELVWDVDLDGFDSATTGKPRNGRTLLTVRYLDDTKTSFSRTRKNFAQQVVEAIQARPR